MGKEKLAQVGIERKSMHPMAHRQHQHGTGPIQGVASGHLPITRLQKVSGLYIAATVHHFLGRPQHRKNAAHGAINLNVAGAIDWIEQQQVFAARLVSRNLVRGFQLFGHHARQVSGPVVHLGEAVVGEQRQRFALCMRNAGSGVGLTG